MNSNRHSKVINSTVSRSSNADLNTFVLEKDIFSNIFNKDIKRVFIYKKSERLAKAIYLITPAFRESPSLRDRLDKIAIRIVDAAILSPSKTKEVLSKELLALSSVLSIAQTGRLLSNMNVELIAHEAHVLLQEVASYEEPRLFLDDIPSLAELAKEVGGSSVMQSQINKTTNNTPTTSREIYQNKTNKGHGLSKGQVKDKSSISTRREAVIAVVRSKGSAYIKDVSMVIRNVSEKTIQRELAALVKDGVLTRSGERRWTSYSVSNK